MVDKKSFVENLIDFGLTRQEAAIYEVLLANEAMTGYEVSKATGISRSNAYSSLAGLVEKGAAYLIEGESNKYMAVGIKNFTGNVIKALSKTAEVLEKTAPAAKKENHGYITVSGFRHIEDKIDEMLSLCEKRLYFLAEASVIERFRDKLSELVIEGKKVVIISEKNLIEGAKSYVTTPEKGQIRFITDSSLVLTGTLTGASDDTCLYSSEPNLVSIMKEALKNKIILIEKNIVSTDEE